MKGKKFQGGIGGVEKALFHSTDTTMDERAVSVKTSLAVKAIREMLEATGLMTTEATKDDERRIINADWDYGMVRYVDPTSGEVRQLFQIPRGAPTTT